MLLRVAVFAHIRAHREAFYRFTFGSVCGTKREQSHHCWVYKFQNRKRTISSFASSRVSVFSPLFARPHILVRCFLQCPGEDTNNGYLRPDTRLLANCVHVCLCPHVRIFNFVITDCKTCMDANRDDGREKRYLWGPCNLFLLAFINGDICSCSYLKQFE